MVGPSGRSPPGPQLAVVSAVMRRTLLIVTGPGRSGTSTMAGVLHHVGAHVPGPFLDANPSNPKGFYESRWAVRFHNRLLRRANVGLADGRPEAVEHVRAAVGPRHRDALRDHLREITRDQHLTVVKDPRAMWTLELWRSVAEDLDLDTAVAVLMRAPADVVGSRATHYSAGLAVLGEAGYAIHNCAGWVNGMLTAERESRASRRAFVSYDTLLSDWRSELRRTFAALGLPLPTGLGPAAPDPHPADEFVDPTLSRHRLTWDDLPVPTSLSRVADEVWSACASLQEPDEAAEPTRQVDSVRARYEQLYAESRALVHDHTVAEVKASRREGRGAPPDPSPPGTSASAGRVGRRLLARLRGERPGSRHA